jgi:putative DNA primase/helicase
MTHYSRSNILLPHFEEAALFLEALAGKDASFTFQTFDDVKDRKEKSLTRIFHGTFNQHKQVLKALNAQGAGVYVTVNQTDLKGRTLANIVKVRAVWIDLDGAPIQPVLDLPEDLQPHIIIESSPNKYHAYWLVNNCTLEEFKPLQQALAAKFDGDKAVCDLPRVMRLAGFSHNKAESFITRIHTMQDNLYPFSVNKLMVGLGLKNDKKAKSQAAIVAISAIDDDFTIGLPPTADLMADLKSALDYLPCEEYDDWVRQAMRLKTLGDAGLDLFLSWSSKGSTFDRVDAIHKWRGLHADRTGYKAIFSEAQRNGWTNPLSSHKPPKTEKTDPIDPDLINKTIEALPTPEERNTARALQDALTYIAPQDAMEGSFSTGERVIGFGLSYEYKQAQDSIGALLATDWDGKTGGNSLSHYMGADLEHPNPIKIASIYGLAQSKGWVMPPDEWQDPESITAHYEAEDYPLEQLPDPLRLAVIAVTNYLQCPLAMVANSLLGALALSIQGLVNVARDSQLVSVSSLFLLLIGESGERKSACDKMLTQHLNELDIERFKADSEERKEYAKALKIWQAKLTGAENALKRDSEKGLPTQEIEQRINALYLEEPLAPRGTNFLLEDATPEGLIKLMDKGHPTSGLFSSEAGIVFGSHGMASDSAMRNMATLNKFWDGDAIRVTRSDTNKNVLLTGRRLTLSLAVQASTVRTFFDGSKGLARGTGFGARFLIAWPKSTQGFRPYKEPANSFSALDTFKRKTLELINTDLVIDEKTGAIEAHTLTLSAKAKAVWITFYNDTEAELKTGGELTDIKDVTSKAGDNAARIAALFHVYEYGVTGTISEDHMTKACHLMAWYLMESRRFFGEIALPKELSNATLLDTWLIDYCKDNQLTRISTMLARQLCPNSIRSKAVYEETIKNLTELKRIRTTKEGKKKWIEVNPKLLEA